MTVVGPLVVVGRRRGGATSRLIAVLVSAVLTVSAPMGQRVTPP